MTDGVILRYPLVNQDWGASLEVLSSLSAGFKNAELNPPDARCLIPCWRPKELGYRVTALLGPAESPRLHVSLCLFPGQLSW